LYVDFIQSSIYENNYLLMNIKPTAPRLNQGQNVTSINPLQRVKNLVRDNLIRTIIVTIAGSLLLTGVSTYNIWSIYNSFKSTVTKQFALQNITGDLVYQDEFLTMSAKMLVSTGDLQWETRYSQMVPTADATLKKFLANITEEQRLEAKKTDNASAKLFELEDKSFKLIKAGKQKEAYQLLMGDEYATQKKIFSSQNNLVLEKVDKSIAQELANYQQQLFASIVFAGITLPILLGSWILVLSAVRDYIRDRQQAQASLAASQADLLQLNEELAGEVEIRARQEQQIRSESELLQADVNHILNVVCAIEEGDLTVQADVNERVTGLVSDTLNRSIESLDRIISTVVNTARTVTDDASQLEQAAMETAQQAQSQTTEVRSVQLLMDNINALTADSRQQAIETDAAVQLAKSAVSEGQQAMKDTADGIDTLQQGTDQIVKRTELLTEFVDLAAQFSKDQKRVASLTRVLALNASTLSTRAVKEENPAQFASLAKEFEAIARQVSDLATDTNLSLVTLQQRTDRVQTVTSGLSDDVNQINQLVQKFTGEVKKSRQAFDNIQTVTGQVAQMGEKVNNSSQDIVQVVNDTLIAIQSIATIAQVTEAKARITREQVQSMGNLARRLLEMVEFFKLTPSASTPPVKLLAAANGQTPTEREFAHNA
jgi:methyl-accepting chemotaxis protein PixJ